MNTDTEYLNVDEIVPQVKKVVKIQGKTYDFKTPSIGEFLEEMKRVKKFQKEMEASTDDENDEDARMKAVEGVIESMQRTVAASFPKIPENVLKSLTFDQLAGIRNFVNSQIQEESAEAEDESGNVSKAQ